MPFDPNDLAALAAMPTESVTMAGTTYLVPRPGPSIAAALIAYMQRAIPRPTEVAKRHIRELKELLPPEKLERIWDAAVAEEKEWPPSMESADGIVALYCDDGKAELLYHGLRRTVAGWTREQAQSLAAKVGDDEYQEFLGRLFPKAPAPPTRTAKDQATATAPA